MSVIVSLFCLGNFELTLKKIYWFDWIVFLRDIIKSLEAPITQTTRTNFFKNYFIVKSEIRNIKHKLGVVIENLKFSIKFNI